MENDIVPEFERFFVSATHDGVVHQLDLSYARGEKDHWFHDEHDKISSILQFQIWISLLTVFHYCQASTKVDVAVCLCLFCISENIDIMKD